MLPDTVLETRKSRAVLPRDIPLDGVVENLSLCSSMVYYMMRGNIAEVA